MKTGDNPWSRKVTLAEAFEIMQAYLELHRDIIDPFEEVGWFVAHVTDEIDPAHQRQWLEAAASVRVRHAN